MSFDPNFILILSKYILTFYNFFPDLIQISPNLIQVLSEFYPIKSEETVQNVIFLRQVLT